MASKAATDVLEPLLDDVQELIDAHGKLRTGKKGRQWRLGALNRAVVVMSVSAWEAYIEAIVGEALEVARPSGTTAGTWPALKLNADTLVGRFNQPNVQKVRELIHSTVGVDDVDDAWSWRNCPPSKARVFLDDMVKLRNRIAHGVKPRPTVHNGYAAWTPKFLRRLAASTDAAVARYLVTTLGLGKSPW